MANPIIQPHPGSNPFYLVTFETISDRTRWLLRNGFSFDSLEHSTARWTSTHNGSDFTHWLEMIPYAFEHACNPRSLCLKVLLHPYNKRTKPIHRPSSKPIRDSLGTYGSNTTSKEELDF